MKKVSPTSAIIAVTSLCNSRCQMCNFWKKRGENLPLSVLSKLPASLSMIDITGGEPFLRNDLPEVVKVIKTTCPKARLLITTNGLLAEKISRLLPEIIKVDDKIAFRVSLDGWRKTHDFIRGVPGAFEKVMKTLYIFKKGGVTDLGVIFTLTRENTVDLEKVIAFLKKEKLELSVNLVHDADQYFGKGHLDLRPKVFEEAKALKLARDFYRGCFSLKAWAKVWYYSQLLNYSRTGKRIISCGACEDFFYLDQKGDLYPCHFKGWRIGNLKEKTFEEIWSLPEKTKFERQIRNCHSCFMVCTTKSNFSFQLVRKIVTGKFNLVNLITRG